MNTSKQSHLKSVASIYKSFVRSHLDYGVVISDKAYSNFLQQRLASLQ